MKKIVFLAAMLAFFILIGCSHQLYKRMEIVEAPPDASIDQDVEYCTRQANTSVGDEIGRQLVLLFLPLQTSFNNRIDKRYRACMEEKGYLVRRNPPGYGFNE